VVWQLSASSASTRSSRRSSATITSGWTAEGCPAALVGEAIGAEARILAVCDVYDALISSRVYRPPWTHQEAMALLRDQVGTAFDARCVNGLAEVLDLEAGRENELDRARENAAARSLPQATAWAS